LESGLPSPKISLSPVPDLALAVELEGRRKIARLSVIAAHLLNVSAAHQDLQRFRNHLDNDRSVEALKGSASARGSGATCKVYSLKRRKG